ncbi:MAG: hypothetical protein U5R31_03565 [Acidimicrobiia bacterium]|nr:hypothetical protein [Acidimicrobiia bacterium]
MGYGCAGGAGCSSTTNTSFWWGKEQSTRKSAGTGSPGASPPSGPVPGVAPGAGSTTTRSSKHSPGPRLNTKSRSPGGAMVDVVDVVVGVAVVVVVEALSPSPAHAADVAIAATSATRDSVTRWTDGISTRPGAAARRR